MANFHLRSSRDAGTSVRDEEVRRKNIKQGRGNSTAEKKKPFKAQTPKGVTREEMSGKSDAPKPKAAAPKPKAKSPFALPSKAPVPTPRPDPITTGSTPTPYMYGSGAAQVPGQSMAGTETAPAPAPYMYGGGVTPGQSMAGTETAPRPAPPFVPPFNPQMSDASILHTVPPALQTPPPGNFMAGQQTAPRPPLPGPMDMLGGGVAGRPPVGMGGATPFGNSNPPVSGMGGASGAGNPVIDPRAMLARLLGLGV